MARSKSKHRRLQSVRKVQYKHRMDRRKARIAAAKKAKKAPATKK